MEPKTREAVVTALRQAANRLLRSVEASSGETFGDTGAGRVFLVDGEETSFEDLWLANAEDEDFVHALVGLNTGDTLQWGGGAAAEFEVKRVK